MPRKQTPGIFCLEGAWDPKLTDPSTVRPLLELLAGRKEIKFIHKDVATVNELQHYLNKWLQTQYESFSVGFLAFHGTRGKLSLGRRQVTLEMLAEFIGGRGSGRILHFSSCSTLDTDEEDEIRQFLKRTKLKAVCGYRSDVEWLESAAFEVLLVEALAYYRRVDAVSNFLWKDYPNLCKRLDFRMVW